jgi:hypothetical protein
MARKSGPKTGSMKLYRAYPFRDKDPAIDAFRTVLQDKLGTRNPTRKQMKIVEVNGGPIVQTVYNWLEGDTRKPMNCTMEAAGRAVGKMRVWVDDDSTAGRKRAKREAMPEKVR